MDSERPAGVGCFPAVASFHADGIRHHARNRELTLLVAGDALLWQPLFLGQSTHAGARGRQYRGVPPDDRPPSNRMERGADSARQARIAGLASLTLWVGIIAAGRMMA